MIFDRLDDYMPVHFLSLATAALFTFILGALFSLSAILHMTNRCYFRAAAISCR